MTFVNRDGAGTLKLGQARGVAMLVPAAAGLPVAEYAPNAMKKAVVGAGHADKRQIDHMVRMQLPGADPVGPDAADALAIALCHAFHARNSGRLAQALAAGGDGHDRQAVGRLDYAAMDHVLIDVGGVGYVVHCSDRTLPRFRPRGGRVALYRASGARGPAAAFRVSQPL
jgi:hypothetical protein